MPQVRLLALDSATEALALAVCGPRGDEVRDLPGGARASDLLLPELGALLVQAQLSKADLDGIAFVRGPGAFTGLRTACAVAQGLAFGLGKPVLALDSLMLVAEQARLQQPDAAWLAQPLWVAMDARMGELYAACYAWTGQGWREQVAPALYEPQALRQRWQPQTPHALTGTGLELGDVQADAQLCLPIAGSRAAALASLAKQQAQVGPWLAAQDALPLYLRDKVALTTAERQAAARAVEAP
ncbi:tRNA (adenosine(37)-N6)-threonylcarbamoyltransferase complex dimerization subunit type 1 TsaB [Roseateles sp. BYS180W]|uniref:tRNA (Adenosine(37)-N6)-threonylcarbamoyltransferase complex dimerization subunit type 1 TsaB n=1 Tax=Roseateles rivi TaxID=3299028 RepID=A0ABW7FWM6_9BURK